jgi:NADH dehydrogenase FAD-containing subunit
MRIVVLGGGFGGVATVRHLERVLRRRTNVEMVRETRAAAHPLTSVARE